MQIKLYLFAAIIIFAACLEEEKQENKFLKT